MNYIIEKFNAGEVVVINGVHGWYFEEGFAGEPEHRPLMADAMEELLTAGLCTEADVKATDDAREINDEKIFAAFIESQANRTPEQIAEERFEERAAFGAGEEIVNIITGETHYA